MNFDNNAGDSHEIIIQNDSDSLMEHQPIGGALGINGSPIQ